MNLKLKIKLVSNLITIAILDISFFIGAYSLYKEMDLAVVAMLLAAFGIGLSITLETITVIEELREGYYRNKYSQNFDEDDCGQCGDQDCEHCRYNYDDYEDDNDGYPTECNGECGPDCCSITGGPCCKDEE